MTRSFPKLNSNAFDSYNAFKTYSAFDISWRGVSS